MARFVILEHDHPFLHWDLMLECGDVLRTWRLLERPRQGDVIVADASFDHRLHYLDYEGPVSGNRGNVKKWDAGIYEGDLPIQIDSTEIFSVKLKGEKLEGKMTVARQDELKWAFTFE